MLNLRGYIDDVLRSGDRWFRADAAIARAAKALRSGGFLLGGPTGGAEQIKKYVGVAFSRKLALAQLLSMTGALLFVVASSRLDSHLGRVNYIQSVVWINMCGAEHRWCCMAVTKHARTWLRRYQGCRDGPVWPSVGWELWEVRSLLPAIRCDWCAGALLWVAAQDAQGNSSSTFGGYGVGLGSPPLQDIVDLPFRLPAKGLTVDTGRLI